MTDLRSRLDRTLGGAYTIDRELSGGGMSHVFVAEECAFGRRVVVKVLREDLTEGVSAARFKREISVAAKLQHPHIVPLLTAGEDGQTLYYTMPFVDGESLRDRLRREGELPVADVIRVVREVASALSYAHRRGIIHRDIKPENVLFSDGSAVVTDFGIAKALEVARTDGDVRASTITHLGVALGTPAYMAPEQAAGDPTIDHRADLYALGCVAYELLAGRPPFEGRSSQQLLAAHAAEAPTAITVRRVTTPPQLAGVVMHCLEKRAADRPQSAEDVIRALDAIVVSSSGAAAMPMPSSSLPSRRPSSNRVAWATVAASALVIASVGGYMVGARVARERSPFPSEWQAEKLNGPPVALAPRVSSDGKFVAFEAMEGLQTQVGVLTTGSGDYQIRTHAPHGFVQELAWSPDGRIYFSRHQGGLKSVFSVLHEGDERLVLDGAADVQVLPDNGLLFARLNAQGVAQLYRSRPEREPIPLGALQASSEPLAFAFRAFRDGREVVFYGRPLGAPAALDHLYVLDLASGATRTLAPALDIKKSKSRFPLAVSADDRWVLFDLPAGDLHRIVAVPRDGGNDVRILIPLMSAPLGLDVDSTGSIYVDQPIEPVEIMRYWPATARLERSPVQDIKDLFPLPDGRYLIRANYSGRNRVSLFSIGKSPEPFVRETTEETSFPVSLMGPDRVALRVGRGSNTQVAVVSIATGTIVSRLSTIPAANIVSLAGALDGRHVYYTASGFVWEADVDGNPPRKVCTGNEVAVSPDGRLLVQRNTPAGNNLVWVHPTGDSREEPILLRDSLQLVMGGANLSPNAVGKDGRIVVRVSSRGSWYAPAALLDPVSGRFEVLEPGHAVDAARPGWGADGSIVSLGTVLQSSVWRFRPIGR